MSHHDDVLLKMSAQIFRDFDTILHHAIRCRQSAQQQGLFFQGSTCASLVPLHYREALFPGSEQRKCPRVGYIAGPSMQK